MLTEFTETTLTIEIFSATLIIVALIVVLFFNWLRPSIAFLGAVFGFIILQIVQVEDLLQGFANKQIILIFLLIILSSGIQRNLGSAFFFQLFSKNLSPFQFRSRMMVLVASLSSVLNNTPVVAFMIPFTKSWAEANNYAASKFLIPLSFATILGGMITVVGTSTNLVLSGLLYQSGLPLLEMEDFLYPGLLVSVLGITYLAFCSQSLLPDRSGNKEEVIRHLNEYLVETIVSESSNLIGKSIEQAGLRQLKELFLVEIVRANEVITAVDSAEKIVAHDSLFFAGNTSAILNLINQKNGLNIREESADKSKEFSKLTEAIVPSGSLLVGQSLKDIGFRDLYKASVISIYRKGVKVRGNLGEIILQSGDLLLLLCAQESFTRKSYKDLIFLSMAGELETKFSLKRVIPSVIALVLLAIGIAGGLDLFLATISSILVMIVFKVLDLNQIKAAVDLDLLVVLVSALSIGIGIQNSGAAAYLVQFISDLTLGVPIIGSITVLFLITLGLTSLITNAAAVTIMFPIAFEMGLQSGVPLTPFFIAIAFAASADFMTPIGYQTNLMVMGPGNYKFQDYTRVGLPLALIYTIVVLLFINFYYL